MDLVDEEDGARLRLERADDGLQPRLELAAELRAGEERSHVERVDADVLQDRGHRAAVDAEREALDDGRLAHARVAHEDGVVLPPPAEHVDGALELALAADERVDAARGRLRDQVDGEGAERIARRAGALLVVLRFFLARRAGRLGHLCNTMRDVADHIEARDALLGEEVGGVRLGLAEDGDQDVAPVELLAPGRLHVRGGALEDALEADGLLRRRVGACPQALHVLLQVRGEVQSQALHVAAAGAHHGGDPLVVEQRVQQVLDADELVPLRARVADGEREARLEAPGQPHSSSSTVQRRGNSCARARASTRAARVSAMSRG